MSHARHVVRQALVAEYHRLKLLVPESEISKKNMELIETASPVHIMTHDQLCSYVDLLHRSVKKHEQHS